MSSRSGKRRRVTIKAADPSPVDHPAGPDEPSWFGDRLRRIALGLTAALVVSRAYWPSEYLTELDTGQQLPWTFALLAVALLAVVGSMMAGSLRFRFSWADVAIIGLMVAVGVSASGALDRRVAINMAWQWGGVGLVYLLFRNLPGSAKESRALGGILAATAASVSLYALYQAAIELPELRRLSMENPARFLARYGMAVAPGSPEYQQLVNRVLYSSEAFSTFGLANSLAGYVVGPLVLAIGVLIAGIGARWQGNGTGGSPAPRASWFSVLLASLPVLLMLVVIQLTKSRAATLGMLVGVAILAAWFARRLGKKAVAGLVLGLAAVGGLIGAVLWRIGLLDKEVLTESSLSLGYRLEYWIGTWRVLTDGGAWLTGLGPGNFRPAYRVHKLVEASEDIADPHNMFLEVWVVGGIVALILLLVGLVLVLGNLFAPGRLPESGESRERVAVDDDPKGVRSLLLWAGLGGWLGVILVGDLNIFADDNEGLIRWLILGLGWGLAVALAGPLWGRTGIPSVAFGAAIVAMVINLLAAGGIGYAAIASMLWGLAAVGMNLREDRPAGRLRELPGLFPAFVVGAVLAAVIGIFYGTVSPFWRSQSAMNRADQILAQRPNAPRQEDLDRVGALLDRAINADIYATRTYLAMAELELFAWISRGAAPEDAVWNRIEDLLEAARTPPRDPRSLEVRMARIRFAQQLLRSRPDLPSSARERLRTIIADARYTIATELSPTRPIDRAQAAEALAAIGRYDRAIEQAEIALDLDDQVPPQHTDKKLSAEGRERLSDVIPEWRSQQNPQPGADGS